MAIVHLGNVLQGTAYSSGIDTRIPWSALEYSGDTQVITGISGSAIGGVGGGVDSATVSAIASSYVESGVSGKMDASAMSAYALSSDVSGVIDTVSTNSASWSVSGGNVYTSGFAYNDSAISSIDESSLYDSSAHARISTLSTRITNVSAAVSGKMDASASSNFVPISAVSSWSSDIQTLSAALSAIQTAMANVYTLSAGSGIQISSNTSTKVTVVQLS